MAITPVDHTEGTMVANAALDPSRPTGLNATVAVNAALPGSGRSRPDSRWRRFLAAVPLRFALLATTAVWAMGCVWSFREQALFAAAKGFAVPWLLPAVIDGLAIALACVAYAASLDGRPGTIASHPKASDASEPRSGASTHPAADAPARRGPDASAPALPADPLTPTGANRTSADTPPPVRADAQLLPSHPQSPQLIPADSR